MVEIASVVILGILAQWLAWRTKIPAILPLIIIGLLVGPIAQYYLGEKLIEPSYNDGSGEGLFVGGNLFYFVSLSIGVILFEGGLTLKLSELDDIRSTVIRLISVGSIITLLGGALAARWIVGMSWELSFLFAGLIIVTGPTVIAPILRNVPLNKNVANILKWEGILIDPVGALVAVLVFGFVISGEGQFSYTYTALWSFVQIVVVGLAIGLSSAWALYQLIKRELIPHYLLNVFTLAMVLSSFVLSDIIIHESGLLTVVVMGMRLGNLKVPQLKEILSFKESITVLLISVLFILLSANINMEQLFLLDGSCLLLFTVVILVLRPLGVLASTVNTPLSLNERIFISWVGPRGIVAAGIASLFGIDLMEKNIEGADLLTPLVFFIVLGTVLLNATTARWLAKFLKVTLSKSEGILIVGANPAPIAIAKYLQDNGRQVVLLDSSEENIEEVKNQGLYGIQENIFRDDITEHFELLNIGYLLAMTGSDQVNIFACKHYRDSMGENGTFRLVTRKEMNDEHLLENAVDDSLVLFGKTANFLKINELAQVNPEIKEVTLTSKNHYEEVLKTLTKNDCVPVFYYQNGSYEPITASEQNFKIQEGDLLCYIGPEVEFETV